MKITAPPEHIKNIMTHMAKEGHDVYLVGGCVRDAVMERPIHDWDIATSAAPVEVASLFPKTVLTGERFGTVSIVLPETHVEVTTFRIESEYKDGRRPENVEFVSNIDEDLGRRDFTINAMAESIDGELIDPYGGLKDIENKIIRCVGGANTRFKEDALRMLRAFRFRAQLDFTIDAETMSAICANSSGAKQISTDRVRNELVKTLMTQKPEVAGEMIKVGLLDRFFTSSGKPPEDLEKIAGLPVEQHIRGSVFCAILLDKGLIKEPIKLLREMQLDSKTAKTTMRALSITEFPESRTAIKQLMAKHGTEVVRDAAAINDIRHGSTSLKTTDEIITAGECYKIADLAITGKDLISMGHAPGPELGETLEKLLDHVIKNPQDNTRDTLLTLVPNSY